MEFEIEWLDPMLVVCRTKGVASVEGYGALMHALISDPRFHPGVDLITDHTRVSISEITATDIEKVAALRARYLGALSGRSAGVVGPNSPLRYGFGRMFEALVGSQTGAGVKVFETLGEAIAWLRESNPDSPEERAVHHHLGVSETQQLRGD